MGNATYYKKGIPGKKSTIQELPLQSIVLAPEPGETLCKGEPVIVRGVAFSGGSGNSINTVEVSLDGGKSWANAALAHDEIPNDGSSKSHGWVRWSAKCSFTGTDTSTAEI